MKQIKTHLIGIIMACCLFGCTQRKDEGNAFRILDYTQAQPIEFANLFDVQGAIIIPLETTEKSIISDNFIVKLMHGNVLVFDYQRGQVLRFNLEGKFLNLIGEQGKGPEELLNPSDFYIDPKNQTVEILCEPGSTIKKFSFQGEFRSKISFDFPSHSFIKDSKDGYYFYRGVNSGYSEYRVTYVDASSKLNELLMDPGNAPVGLVMDKQCLVENNGVVFLKEILFNQIVFLAQGQFVDGVKIHFGVNDIRLDDLPNYPGMMAFFQQLDNDGFHSIKSFDVLDNHAFISFQYQKASDDIKTHYMSLNLLTDEMISVSKNEDNELFRNLEFQMLLPDNKFLFAISSHNYHLLENTIPTNAFESFAIKEDDNPVLIVF